MPQLTLRGIDPALVAKAAPLLAQQLAAVIQCPEDYFTFDCLTVRSYSPAGEVNPAPFIEILWFERGKSVRDEAAQVIDRVFGELGVKELEICFWPASKAMYYGNGKPYGEE